MTPVPQKTFGFLVAVELPGRIPINKKVIEACLSVYLNGYKFDVEELGELDVYPEESDVKA